MPRMTRESYAANPKYCKYCGKQLTFEQRYNLYCGSSCSISVNNRGTQRNFKGQTFCKACGQPKAKRQNVYCDDCIAKRVYNPRIEDVSVVRCEKIRRRILIDQRGNQCEQCGLSEWRGQPLRVEMHHIDGNTDNNAAENLQLLCPNCHSQTPDYKGLVKNKTFSRQLKRRKRYADGETW